MPEIKHSVEKICYFCRDYTIRVGEVDNGAYCKYYGKFFPDPTGWYYDKSKKGRVIGHAIIGIIKKEIK